MLDDDADGLNADLNSAARCANSDWDGVPHGAKSNSEGTMILGPQRRNRRWDPREKARITAESFEPGANISAVARHHGVSPGLLHYWRRMVRDRAAVEAISLVPLEVDDGGQAPVCELEIEIGGGRILVRGAVDASVLRTVCDALRPR
jgi:transposase